MDNIKKKIFDISSIGITDGVSAGIAGMFWFYIASELGPENYGEITFLISIAAQVLGIGISVIALNLAMYIGIPAIVIIGIKKKN